MAYFLAICSDLEMMHFDISSECSAGVIRRGDPYTPKARQQFV